MYWFSENLEIPPKCNGYLFLCFFFHLLLVLMCGFFHSLFSYPTEWHHISLNSAICILCSHISLSLFIGNSTQAWRFSLSLCVCVNVMANFVEYLVSSNIELICIWFRFPHLYVDWNNYRCHCKVRSLKK
jgi:hypothetical protein